MLDFSVTFIITIINIVILFFILKAILFKPVTKFMAERSAKIQASIDRAEDDKAAAKSLLEHYEEKLKNAESDAEALIKTAHEQAEAEAARIIAEGRQAAEALVAGAQKQIETEQQAAFTKFKLEAAALVISAAARLSARDFNNEDSRRYASMLLEELSAQKIALNKGAL